MFKNLSLTTFAILSVLALLGAGCADKKSPKSTTTTRTQTSVEQDDGQKSTSDVTETNTEQADGTHDIERTETTKKTTPATPPTP